MAADSWGTGDEEFLEVLHEHVRAWETGGATYAVRPRGAPASNLHVRHFLLRFSRPEVARPVPDHYVTVQISVVRSPSRAFSLECRVEQETFVYSDEEMRRVAATLFDRVLAAKREAADLVGSYLDLVESFEATRLPEEYPDTPAHVVQTPEVPTEEVRKSLERISTVVAGHRDRSKVAAGRRDRARDEEAAVRIQSLARGHAARKFVTGLRSLNGQASVRASGAASELETAAAARARERLSKSRDASSASASTSAGGVRE